MIALRTLKRAFEAFGIGLQENDKGQVRRWHPGGSCS
jgi:hypothetical protein